MESSWQRWARLNPEKALSHNARRRYRKDKYRQVRWYRILRYVRYRVNARNERFAPYYRDKGIRCFLTVVDIARLWFADKAWNMKQPELDRIDPDDHYHFGNCRFIEKAENFRRAVHQDQDGISL